MWEFSERHQSPKYHGEAVDVRLGVVGLTKSVLWFRVEGDVCAMPFTIEIRVRGGY